MTYTALDPVSTATGFTDDRTDKAVQSFIQLIEKNYDEKVKHDGLMANVQDFYEHGFNIKLPNGQVVKITSKLIHQVLWRMIARAKPLDFALFASGRTDAHRKLSTAGVATVLDEGGFLTVFRGKLGLCFQVLLYGDAFLQVYETGDPDNPVEYLIIPATNVYTDTTAVGLYGNGRGRDATKLVTITPMTWGEFCSEYPKFIDKVVKGKIPRESAMKDQSKTWSQETEGEEDLVEVACGYDIVNKCFVKFAGASCTIIEKMEGDEYPFTGKKKKPYIPVLQFFFDPASEGLYNHGIGGMLYDIAQTYQTLFNLEVSHIGHNVNPLTLISTAHGQSANFLNRLKMGYKMQENGKWGVVAMERDAAGNNTDAVSAQTLLTANNASEFQMMLELLDREVRRLGFSVDDIDHGAQTTATQILSEEEAQNMRLKQMMEYNASNFKRVIELTMYAIKNSKKSEMPLNVATPIKLTDPETGEMVEIKPEDATLELVQDEFKRYNYFVRVNARSGAYPSNVMKLDQVMRIAQNAQPGSGAHIKAMKQLADISDFDAEGEDFIMAAPEMGGAPEAMDVGAPTSETDRLTINPRQSTQVPTI